MTQVIVVNGGKLLSGAPLFILLVLKYADSVAYSLYGVKYLMLKVIPLNTGKEGMDFSGVAIKFFG